MKPLSVTIVILNWNQALATISCAESVIRAVNICDAVTAKVQLLIVDNGSKEAEVENLREWCASRLEFPVSLVESPNNLGYSGGMNLAVLEALKQGADYLWLLNNDTTVEENSLQALIAYCQEHPDEAITGVTVVDAQTGRVQAAGGHRYYRWLGLNRPLLKGRQFTTPADLPQATPDYIDGAAMWLKGDFLRRIGGLPKAHFLYFEELELAARLTPMEGSGWCREALVSHLGGGSTANNSRQVTSTYHAAYSALTYTRKHHRLCLPSVIIARLVGNGLRSIVRRQPALFTTSVRAVRDFFAGRPAIYPER